MVQHPTPRDESVCVPCVVCRVSVCDCALSLSLILLLGCGKSVSKFYDTHLLTYTLSLYKSKYSIVVLTSLSLFFFKP